MFPETKKAWSKAKHNVKAALSLWLMMKGLEMVETVAKEQSPEQHARVALLGVQTVKVHMKVFP